MSFLVTDQLNLFNRKSDCGRVEAIPYDYYQGIQWHQKSCKLEEFL